MQFKVPQFLEVEDKIFGPFTFRQFVYLAGGAGLCFFLYKLLGLLWGTIPILAIAGFSLLLAFYRPNNKPFIDMLESSLKYFAQGKLYVWKKPMEKKKEILGRGAEEEISVAPKRLSGEKLKDLAWSLDVMDLSKKKEDK